MLPTRNLTSADTAFQHNPTAGPCPLRRHLAAGCRAGSGGAAGYCSASHRSRVGAGLPGAPLGSTTRSNCFLETQAWPFKRSVGEHSKARYSCRMQTVTIPEGVAKLSFPQHPHIWAVDASDTPAHRWTSAPGLVAGDASSRLELRGLHHATCTLHVLGHDCHKHLKFCLNCCRACWQGCQMRSVCTFRSHGQSVQIQGPLQSASRHQHTIWPTGHGCCCTSWRASGWLLLDSLHGRCSCLQHTLAHCSCLRHSLLRCR
jgi:hypothetical protein